MIKKSIFRLVLAWAIWFFASLAYFHQYYLRQIIGSLSHYLMHDFFLTIVDLTDLAVLFFISYIITLPIAGVLLDRFGIKKMLPLALIVAAISCFLFAYATNDAELIIARIMMGSSATFSLLSALIIIRKYFKAQLFPLLSGLTLSIGLLGGVFGSWFLIYASKVENWRLLMSYAGWVSLVLGMIFYLSVDRYDASIKNNEAIASASLKKFLRDIKIFLESWQNWLPGFYGGFILTPIVAFASFWAAPFLKIHYQIHLVEAAYFTSYIFIGYAVGAPIIALLGQKLGLKLMMILSSSLALLTLILIINCKMQFAILMFCLFLLGSSAGAFSLTTIIIKLTTPADIAASAFSFNTMLSQLVGALTLWIMGQYIYYWHGVKMIQKNQIYAPNILEHTMELLVFTACLGIIVAFFIRSPAANKALN